MKKYIYSGLVFMAAILVNSCADDELQPILTFDQMGKGGYTRLISESNREFDLFNLSTASYTYTVEFVTINQGTDVTAYTVDVMLNSGSLMNWKTFSQSDFTTNTNGIREITVTVALSELLSIFGVQESDLQPLDLVTFDTEVSLDNGTSFRSSNSSAAVNGTAFAGHLKFRISVTCPMPSTQFVGTYAVTYVNVADAANCFTGGPTLGATIPNFILTEAPGSTTKRTVTFEGDEIAWAFGFAYSGASQFEFVCTEVSMSQSWSLNGSCGDGINLTGGDGVQFDINDDSSFIVEIEEFANGDCGCPVAIFQLKLTKM